MRLLLSFLVLLSFGCKSDNTISRENIQGHYITSITNNEITTKEGRTCKLQTNPGDKIIYLVRHAEKDTLPSKNNPVLTEAGYQRSYRLANMLKQTRVDAIYSTMYNRTMHTVDSLAQAKSLPIQIYQPKDMKKVYEEIMADKEIKTAIISGHSNTTPGMANVFLGKKVLEQGFDESDYDNFLIVNTLADSTSHLYKLRYK